MSGDMQAMRTNMDTNAKEMKEEINGMKHKMDTNTNKIKNDMKDEMKKMRGEMQSMAVGLQVGMMAMARDETRTAGEKMATPRAGTNELGGVQRLSGPR